MFFALVLGMCVGSFLNVSLYRLPRRLSLIAPGSHCPACGRLLHPLELVPFLSYLLLGGRCRTCRVPIGLKYPAVELVMGALFGLAYHLHGPTLAAGRAAALAALLVLVAGIDLPYKTIPNRVVFWGAALGALLRLFEPGGWKAGALGLGAGLGLMLAIYLASRGGMGEGDVKLAGAMGIYLGWEGMLFALMLAFAVGGMVALGLILAKRAGRRTEVPFGPFLALGGIVSAYWGTHLIQLYLRLVSLG
ncbi:MAG: prepilin peptidase [Bacillota bacterium]